MTDKAVLRIVAKQGDGKLWTTWVGPHRTASVTSLAQAVERADRDGQDLLIQPEAYDQMVSAGVAQPGATHEADWHAFA